MKNKKYPTVGTVPNLNRKIVERGQMYTPTTHDTHFHGLVQALQ